MRAQIECYEQYPLRIVFLSNLVTFATYLAGGYILYQLGPVWLAAYLIYILFLEVRVMRGSCTNCYYYGKFCAFGKGKLSAVLFRRGVAKRFAQRKITWKDILPDFMVSIVPLLAGIALEIMNFSLLILALLVLLVLLMSVGNAFVRGSMACKYCKQREIGCPAEKLFKKANSNR